MAASALPVRPRSFYKPELDALRFFAFSWVCALHYLRYPAGVLIEHGFPKVIAVAIASLLRAGVFGVDLFFALSSYLITELLLREKDSFGSVDVRSFYLRRILRIWPLYFLFIALSMIPFFNPDHALTWHYVACLLLLAGNWGVILYGWPTPSIAGPLWTVSIEEQFYLLWPPVVARLSKGGIAAASLLLLSVGFVLRFVLVTIYPVSAFPANHVIWCNTFAHIDPIAAGTLLAVLLHEKRVRLGAIARFGLIVSGIALLASLSHWSLDESYRLTMLPNLIGFPLIALGACSLLIAVMDWPVAIPKPLVYLGKISYGLYVFHEMGLFLADKFLRDSHGGAHLAIRIAASFAITGGVSILSYRFFETPFLRLKNRLAHIHSRPV
jgi:peptidoglycan/LPS O-acetylase OafA/YrhL